jgi:hypothetical protein
MARVVSPREEAADLVGLVWFLEERQGWRSSEPGVPAATTLQVAPLPWQLPKDQPLVPRETIRERLDLLGNEREDGVLEP